MAFLQLQEAPEDEFFGLMLVETERATSKQIRHSTMTRLLFFVHGSGKQFLQFASVPEKAIPRKENHDEHWVTNNGSANS